MTVAEPTTPAVALGRLLVAARDATGRAPELLTAPGPSTAESDVTIRHVAYDSRQVRPGALFCCIPGQRVDGHRFAAQAVAQGAVALLVEHRLDLDVAQVVVDDARAAMAPIAAEFWGHPSRALQVVGVTGTNGKTTVTHLVAAILEADGRRTAVIGTLSGTRTTPEAPDLQQQFATLVADGYHAVAMEVSSHALSLHRVDATRFAVATFTNLSRDHLDFHGTMAAYFAAKARLFEPAMAERAVVNLDDPHGRLLRDAAVVPTVGYSLTDATDLVFRAGGTTFGWAGEHIEVPLAGRHNVSNALAAATTARELGVSPSVVASGLAASRAVPGRFESVAVGQPFGVVVDYAHTPDALERVLEAGRELVGPGGRVLVVFGCGGDRDPSKRAPMGAVASRLADLAVLTSDNPRSEHPVRIIEEVRAGVVPGAEVVVEPDRRAAIAIAIRRARSGDLVVVAGKGHETTQQIGDAELPFDDRVVAAEVLRSLGFTGGGGGSR